MSMSRAVLVAISCALLSGVMPAAGQPTAPRAGDATAADAAGSPATAPAVQPAPAPASAPAPAPSTQPAPAPSGAAPAPSTPSPSTPATPAPAAPARPGEESAEEMLRQMLQPRGDAAEPLQPAGNVPTGVEDAAPGTPSSTGRPLVREGTPLLDRVGRLTPSADGKSFQINFESDGRTLSEPPMTLLPNRRLMELENRLRTSYRDLRLSVSGEVTEYRGKNYLLLTRWSIVQDVVQPLR